MSEPEPLPYAAARAGGFRGVWVANGNTLRQTLVRDFQILFAMHAAFDGTDLVTYTCVIGKMTDVIPPPDRPRSG
jgi:hypothetical protein